MQITRSTNRGVFITFSDMISIRHPRLHAQHARRRLVNCPISFFPTVLPEAFGHLCWLAVWVVPWLSPPVRLWRWFEPECRCGQVGVHRGEDNLIIRSSFNGFNRSTWQKGSPSKDPEGVHLWNSSVLQIPPANQATIHFRMFNRFTRNHTTST